MAAWMQRAHGPQLSSIVEAFRARQTVMWQLKATLFMLIARGQVVYGQDFFTEGNQGEANKYWLLAQTVANAVMALLGFALGCVSTVFQSVSFVGERYESLSPEVQAAVEIAWFSLFVRLVLIYFRSPARVVTVGRAREPDRFIGARTTDSGAVVYDVVVGGTHYALPVVVTGEVDIREEMSCLGQNSFLVRGVLWERSWSLPRTSSCTFWECSGVWAMYWSRPDTLRTA